MEREIIIGKMIRYFLKRDNLTIKQLGIKLDKTESTVSKWINNKSTPMAKDLSKMTYIFNTDIYTLMYGNKDIESHNILCSINNTSSKLEPPRQKIVLDTAEVQLKLQNQKLNNVSSIEEYKTKYNSDEKIPFTRLGTTGAGIGEDLCDDMIEETIYFDRSEVDEELLETANFCIYVNGDSMEPAINRDSYAFVRRTSEIRNGLVALVIYDGTVLIKKIEIKEDCINLVSLNPKYETIKVEPHHQFKLIGKIVQ